MPYQHSLPGGTNAATDQISRTMANSPYGAGRVALSVEDAARQLAERGIRPDPEKPGKAVYAAPGISPHLQSVIDRDLAAERAPDAELVKADVAKLGFDYEALRTAAAAKGIEASKLSANALVMLGHALKHRTKR